MKARPSTKPALAWWKQGFLYGFLVAGVLLSKAIRSFDSNTPAPLMFSIPSLLIAAVIGLIAAPHIFGALKVTRSTSFWALIALFLQQGVFWQVFITGASIPLQR